MNIMYKFISIILICIFAYKATAMQAPYYSEMYIYDDQDDLSLGLYSDIDKPLISDPFILVNKQIFSFNSTMDTVFISPLIEMYITVMPKHGTDSVGNFLRNAGEPLNFLNLMLQGNFAQARVTLGRFMTNTVLGFFGIMDVATDFKLQYKAEDFGQTLAHYGTPIGPYIVLPIFGPSSARDTVGRGVDFVADPFRSTLDGEEKISMGAGSIFD